MCSIMRKVLWPHGFTERATFCRAEAAEELLYPHLQSELTGNAELFETLQEISR